MKKLLFYLIPFFFTIMMACDDGQEQVFIENGKAMNLQRIHSLTTEDEYFVYQQTGSKIPLYAGKMITSGNYRISAELNFKPAKEDIQKPTQATFVLNQNIINLDGEGHRIVTSGNNIGEYELSVMSDLIEYGKDFLMEVEKKAQKLSIYIDHKKIAELDFESDENTCPLKFGFQPNNAILNIRNFTARAGEFTDIELITFTIPQIDLNNNTVLQVIVDKDTVEYYGHPSSVLLDDGKTITMMYLNGHAFGELRWQRSYDGGLTWTGHLPVPDQWNDPPEYDDPAFRKNTPFSEVPTLYRFPNVSSVNRVCMYTGRYPSRYTVSDDGGASWSELHPLLFDGKQIKYATVMFSDMIQLKDGSYMATFHRREGQTPTVFKAITKDGLSFSKPEPIAKHENANLCEGEFIRSPDGNQIALLMRENSRQHQSFITFSEDEGETWTTPREMPPALTGDRHKSLYTPNGRLMISFRDRGHDSPTSGSWVAWVGTFEDLEEGNEGQYRIFLKKNFRGSDCAYPTMHLLPDSTIFLATYGQWEPGQPNYILSFRLNMEELDQLYNEVDKN